MSIPESNDRNLKTEDTDIVSATARQQQSDVVYHRSPTLLASATGGSPEAVQVWAPNTVTLLADAGTVGLFVLFSPVLVVLNYLVLSFVLAQPSFIRLFTLLLFAGANARFIRSIRNWPPIWNKVYITTDASGIAIRTHKRETRAIYWKDIQSVALGEKKINILQPEPTEIRLQGYPLKRRRQLLSLIVQRAQLVPTGNNRAVLVKPGSSASRGKSFKFWDCFTVKAKEAIIGAQGEAACYGSRTIEPEHLLLSLLNGEHLAVRSVLELGVSVEQLEQETRAQLKDRGTPCLEKHTRTSKRTKRVLNYAYFEGGGNYNNCITTGHLLLGILLSRDGIA
nr:hypothetical protein [Armatimonadota bacterium]